MLFAHYLWGGSRRYVQRGVYHQCNRRNPQAPDWYYSTWPLFHLMSSYPITYVSSFDLEERLALWREIAVMFRDKHESALIHGNTRLATAIDFGADGLETCIEDVEELLALSRGEIAPADCPYDE